MSKATTFAAVHLGVAFSAACLMISVSALIGRAIALAGPAVNTLAYLFHELVWNRIRDARQRPPPWVAKVA